MKKCLLLAALLLTAFLSCNRTEYLEDSTSVTDPQDEGVRLVVKATMGDATDTKTAIQSDQTSIYWTEGDAINLFYGDRTNGQFTSQITEPAATAEFFGNLNVAVGTTEGELTAPEFWAVYPYDPDNSCDGSSVTLTIPNLQSGVPGTFADKLNPTVAKAPGLNMSFFNVGSWFIFTVEQTGITSVTLKGGNSENLVGTVKVTMDENGRPHVTEVLNGKKSITMTPATGNSFVPGEQYYMVVIPQTLSNGYTLTLTKIDGSTADCVVTGSKKFERSNYRRKQNADSGLTFNYLDLIQLVSPTLIAETSSDYGWWARGDRFLGDGYVPGTQCFHVNNHVEGGNGKYMLAWNKFTNVDISSIANPALLIRMYINKPEELYLDYLSQIELSSSGTFDEQELCWPGNDVFTNWDGYSDKARYELQAGWNTIVLPFEDAFETPTFNPKKVSWFRWYSNYNLTNMYNKGVEIAFDMLAVINYPAHATGVSLDTEELLLFPGEAIPLTATVAPAKATDKSVTWSSDNTSVATVSSEGLVTAVAPGTATITVTTVDGDYTADCTVTVYDSCITLVSPTLLYDSSTRLGWNADGDLYIGDGYIQGTECFHVNNHTQGSSVTGTNYRIAECKFTNVDVSSIANPALLIRFYINNVDALYLNYQSQIELSSNDMVDEQELAWTGAAVFTNWTGHSANAWCELKNGWNTIVLPFANAQAMSYSPFNPAKANYFRWYSSPYDSNLYDKGVDIAIAMLSVIDLP